MIENTYTDDCRGASPVIGVVLIVAITVILGAVIGAFAMGIGSNQKERPNVAFEMTEEGSDLLITHNGGDDIEASSLSVDCGSGTYSQQFSGTVSSGDQAKCTGVASDDEVSVTWISQDSDDGYLMSTYTVSGSGGGGGGGGSATASIAGIDALSCTESGCSDVYIVVTFSNVQNDEVTVEIKDAGGEDVQTGTLSIDGGEISFALDTSAVEDGENLVATVYDEPGDTTSLDQASCQEGTSCSP